MRTGAIFARGSCRALKWVALLGTVLAAAAGSAMAQATYDLTAPSRMAEGQSLVPISVTFTIPAESPQNDRAGTVSVTVNVIQPTEARIRATQGGHGLSALESMNPPVTRAELADNAAGDLEETVALDDATDVNWATQREGAVTTNAGGTAVYSFTYSEAAATITHTAYLRTNRDSGDAEDELFELTINSATATPPGHTITNTGTTAPTVRRLPGDRDVVVKIDDAQEQNYVISFPGDNDMTIDEGMMAGLELEAVPDRTVNMPFNVTLNALKETADYWLDDNPTAISQNYQLTAVGGTRPEADGGGTSDGTQPFTVHASSDDNNDGDREDDVVTVTARTTSLVGNQWDLASFDLMVIDQHKLPTLSITRIRVDGEDEASVPEGKSASVTLTADRSPDDVPDSETVTVTFSRAADSIADNVDYSINYPQGRNELRISGSATNNMMTGSVTLNVEADEDINLDPESLVLLATVWGSPANGPNPDDPYALDPIPFADTTMAEISAKEYAEIETARDAARAMGAGDNGLWEPGETLTLMASDLFTYADTANVLLGNIAVDDPAVLSAAASNDMVTITAMGNGESAISITGTVVGPSSLEVTQTTSTAVTVKFPISVDQPVITAKRDVQDVADAAVMKAAADSANGIWEPSPNGAMAMIALSDLFDVPASIDSRYLAESSTAMVGAKINDSTMMVELEPMAAGMAMITVTAVDIDEPGQGVSVDFNVEVMAQASLRAMPQATVDQVFMDAGAGYLVAGGDAVMVDMSMLYEVADGVKPTYTATSDMPDVLMASASGTMLTLTPMSGGNAMIMVEAIDSASQSIVSVMYDATVAAAAITYMLEGPEMADLVEGGMDHANGTPGSAMLTVTASAAVAADTEVMITVDRGASTASADDFMLDPAMVTIKAGEMMAATMLTATADDMDERMEELVLFATVGGMEADGEVHLHIWDAAVPALPVIAQLLLAAFLAVGGYRRYLRR